jgi:MYXO-CTERM domain-containing protein
MKLKVVLMVVAAMASLVARVDAGVLGSFLKNGSNTLEDGSREAFFKGAGNVGPGIENGDILIGFSKIVNISPANNYVANSVYAIFSQTFSNISADTDPTADLDRSFEFVATTAVGFRLEDLLGSLDPGGLSATSMIAIVSHASSVFSIDLETVSPGDRPGTSAGVNMFDHLDLLTDEGDLDIVFGLTPGGSDFFGGETAIGIFDSEDFITDLGLAPTDGSNLVNFEGSLSLVYDKPGSPLITSGALVIGGTARLPGAGENIDGAFTFVNDADLKFSAIVVPEPASAAVWGLVALGMIGAQRRRRS